MRRQPGDGWVRVHESRMIITGMIIAGHPKFFGRERSTGRSTGHPKIFGREISGHPKCIGQGLIAGHPKFFGCEQTTGHPKIFSRKIPGHPECKGRGVIAGHPAYWGWVSLNAWGEVVDTRNFRLMGPAHQRSATSCDNSCRRTRDRRWGVRCANNMVLSGADVPGTAQLSANTP